MSTTFIIDPAMGMAGDMFSAALISLGVPANVITNAMTNAANLIGSAHIVTKTISTPEGPGQRLTIDLAANDAHLPASNAHRLLDKAIGAEGLRKPYATFARRALEILIKAERSAHSSGRLDYGQMNVQAIGIAHTPYQHRHNAPHQPQAQAKGEFYVDMFPEFVAGLENITTFSHVLLFSWLHHSVGYSLQVTPPWKTTKGALKHVGLFASRSPNRPNPIGLTLTKVRGVKGNRLLTGPLDLFDGTPIIDIKPHVRTLDQTGVGNDGWLADGDHLELHKKGIPHNHTGEEAVLHEAQDILLDIMGAAAGLQHLGVDLNQVACLTPVAVGGGNISFSHGVLPAPAPATAAILKRHHIPHVAGPVDMELLTPTGAAILAALHPIWTCRQNLPEGRLLARGLGLGTKNLRPLNALRLAIMQAPA